MRKMFLLFGMLAMVGILFVACSDQQDLTIVAHDRLERPHRFVAPAKQRNDHMRKNHHVAQGQHCIGIGVI